MAQHLTFDLVFPPLAADLESATVHVQVEDTGEADAPARPLFRQTFQGVRVSRDERRATIEIEIPDGGSAAAPAVRVHVAAGAGGAIQPGDFVNPSIAHIPKDARQLRQIDLVQVR